MLPRDLLRARNPSSRRGVLRAVGLRRVLDAALVFIALHNVHRVIAPGDSFDGFYVLSVIAATATHGRRGMLLQVSVCIAAMLVDRWWLGALGVRPFGPSEVAGAFAWALLFAVTGLLARSVMRTSAEVTHRRQEAFNAELARQNTALQQTTAQLLAANK